MSERSPLERGAAERLELRRLPAGLRFMGTNKNKAKVPRGRRGAAVSNGERVRATSKEFEREDMGIAPKE